MKTSAGSTVIHKLGADASVCQLFSTEFERETGVPLPWAGESLATLLFKAFETTMKPQRTRRQLTEEERQGLWETQGSVCKLCGCTGTELEVDHAAPLYAGGTETPDNLQMICKACHTEKTQLETLSFVEESNPLLSRFPWRHTGPL
jgi:5-methylcytosine-specific restriction endonuclease McrA